MHMHSYIIILLQNKINLCKVLKYLSGRPLCNLSSASSSYFPTTQTKQKITASHDIPLEERIHPQINRALITSFSCWSFNDFPLRVFANSAMNSGLNEAIIISRGRVQ